MTKNEFRKMRLIFFRWTTEQPWDFHTDQLLLCQLERLISDCLGPAPLNSRNSSSERATNLFCLAALSSMLSVARIEMPAPFARWSKDRNLRTRLTVKDRGWQSGRLLRRHLQRRDSNPCQHLKPTGLGTAEEWINNPRINSMKTFYKVFFSFGHSLVRFE